MAMGTIGKRASTSIAPERPSRVPEGSSLEQQPLPPLEAAPKPPLPFVPPPMPERFAAKRWQSAAARVAPLGAIDQPKLVGLVNQVKLPPIPRAGDPPAGP